MFGYHRNRHLESLGNVNLTLNAASSFHLSFLDACG